LFKHEGHQLEKFASKHDGLTWSQWKIRFWAD